MKLHQLRIDYVTEQDRLLLRISTDDGKELLFWLTRRCVRLMWPLLVEMAQSSPRIALQSNPQAKAALLEMEREKALSGVDFSSPYDVATKERPLGAEPLLIVRLASTRDAHGNQILTLVAVPSQQVDITLDDALLHSFCSLLQKIVADVDWDLTLAMPQAFDSTSETATRTLN